MAPRRLMAGSRKAARAPLKGRTWVALGLLTLAESGFHRMLVEPYLNNRPEFWTLMGFSK